MGAYITGDTIRSLREAAELTQKELGDRIGVTDKTVSKWETGKGLPDISLLEPLSKALRVTLSELFSGERICNRNRAGNLLRGQFYVCPVCGNVVYSVGESGVSCCGILLPPLCAENAEGEHALRLEQVEYDWYVTMEHPMEREHFISFLALAQDDRLQLVKLYPEQDCAARFPMGRGGTFYALCNRHGLVRLAIPAKPRRKTE